MRKNIRAILAAAVLAAFLLPSLAAGQGARAAEAPDMPRMLADTSGSETDIVVDGSATDTDTPPTAPPDIPPAPKSGTGWMQSETTGDIYFYKDYQLKKGFWVGNKDGASRWANNWYYVGDDGRLLTGFHYLDDLKGGKAWYMLQTTNINGEIGKMLSGRHWTFTDAGWGEFSPSYGSQGMCTYTTAWGSYNAATGLWADGSAHRG